MNDSEQQLNDIDTLKYYHRSLVRYSRINNVDESKLLYYLYKLHNYPITIQHLEETGIGVTVNGLRRAIGGEVADFAKDLVTKWKSLVVAEVSQQSEQYEDASGDEE